MEKDTPLSDSLQNKFKKIIHELNVTPEEYTQKSSILQGKSTFGNIEMPPSQFSYSNN